MFFLDHVDFIRHHTKNLVLFEKQWRWNVALKSIWYSFPRFLSSSGIPALVCLFRLHVSHLDICTDLLMSLFGCDGNGWMTSAIPCCCISLFYKCRGGNYTKQWNFSAQNWSLAPVLLAFKSFLYEEQWNAVRLEKTCFFLLILVVKRCASGVCRAVCQSWTCRELKYRTF